MESLSSKFKKMAEARKAKSKAITQSKPIQNKAPQPVQKNEQPRANLGKRLSSPVRKRTALINRLGPKKKSIQDRLGKTIFERLGKKLPVGSSIIGNNHVLGPRLAKGTVMIGTHVLGPKVGEKFHRLLRSSSKM
jgi:hypothetical protein